MRWDCICSGDSVGDSKLTEQTLIRESNTIRVWAGEDRRGTARVELGHHPLSINSDIFTGIFNLGLLQVEINSKILRDVIIIRKIAWTGNSNIYFCA